MLIATLIAPVLLDDDDVARARALLAEAGIAVGEETVVSEARARDLAIDGDATVADRALAPLREAIDVVVQPAANRLKKLLVSDMDSTMIQQECVDELADMAGVGGEVAAITARAMAGELDFEAALRERVALLAGLEEVALRRCLEERVAIMPGAVPLVQTMNALGARTVLVSGGFRRMAEPVAKMIGFDRAEANLLLVEGGRLTGGLDPNIVDADRKAAILAYEAKRYGVPDPLTLAIGDGANDAPMVRAAGLGVAYRAKPVLEAAADVVIRHNDLTAVLLMQGITEKLWVVDPV